MLLTDDKQDTKTKRIHTKCDKRAGKLLYKQHSDFSRPFQPYLTKRLHIRFHIYTFDITIGQTRQDFNPHQCSYYMHENVSLNFLFYLFIFMGVE